ncbi:MAG: 1,6-anhydro-N-acetylmuramyl-L-alanine amidase AmpD [Burkholderiales bacterium]|nr:1,6-anhydro-N-acetylmuramyl-L-alanine amidase AmpD [Burkholderiales bacterium]
MKIDSNGWCKEALTNESPNHDKRPEGTDISLIVVHSISLPEGCYGGNDIRDLFLNSLDFDKHPTYNTLKGLHVSSHFFISRKGKLHQYVSCNDRAWHAGISEFNGRKVCNDFSIGIELEGTDKQQFEEIQYKVLSQLIGALVKVYPIDSVVGHEHIAPGRKTDPGIGFDWKKLIQLGHYGKILSFPFIKDH